MGYGSYLAPIEETYIENSAFVRSYLQHGAWLRCISARRQITEIENSENHPLRRLAAISTFYQQIGMQLEDLASTLISWIVLSRDKTLRIPDILKRIAFVSEREAHKGYATKCINEFLHKQKTVRISTAGFFSEIASTDEEQCLNLFGLRWSRIPSVKLVKKQHQKIWLNLPGQLKSIFEDFDDRGTKGLTKSFNKIKHGPQLDVVNILDLYQRTFTSHEEFSKFQEEFKKREVIPESVRVLFDGANLSATQTPNNPSALILEDHPSDLLYFFHESIFPAAVAVWNLVQFLHIKHIGGEWVQPEAEILVLHHECREARKKSDYHYMQRFSRLN